MSSDRSLQAELADLAGVIERLGGALAIGEEPSNFVAALDDGGADDGRE